MNFRRLVICAGLMAVMTFPHTAEAQDETPVYTGDVGGGFALTGGNTDTSNFNLTAALTRDPKTNHVTKAAASYLHGNQNSVLNLDRTAIKFRHEFTVSGRTFVFGQVDYLRDRFKEIIFLWVPMGGVGYRLVDSDTTQLIFDGSLGGFLEKNAGMNSGKSGSVGAGQRFEQKLTSVTTFSQSIAAMWKMNDFEDSLTNFAAGLTTTLIRNLQLKLEFIDSYKNKPASPTLKKNDTAFVTAFVVKF